MSTGEDWRPAAATVFRRRSSQSERMRSLFVNSRPAALEPCSGRALLLTSAPAWPFVIGPSRYQKHLTCRVVKQPVAFCRARCRITALTDSRTLPAIGARRGHWLAIRLRSLLRAIASETPHS